MRFMKLAHLSSTDQICGGRAKQLFVDVSILRRLLLPSACVQHQTRHPSLRAALDPDDASVSSSKVGDALYVPAMSLRHSGKTRPLCTFKRVTVSWLFL